MRHKVLSFLIVCAIPAMVLADNAYVAVVATLPSAVAGYVAPEQVFGQAAPTFGGSIANTPKMWVLGETDAANEAHELPKPAIRAHKKSAIKLSTRTVANPAPRVKTDCVLCEAERNLLLGKIHKKVTPTVVAQEDVK